MAATSRVNRMNREEFAAATRGLSEAELRKALWTLYWRGTAAMRERIEEAISPAPVTGARRAAPPAPDGGEVLEAVQEFTGLVRSGAYIAGSRAVRPKERSQWRFTFRRLLADARAALAAEDPADGETALAEMIDLACEFRDYDYVRSEDPIEAAAVVVSDEIAVLWRHMQEQHGFNVFAAHAAKQFVRWESRYGWTRSGWGTISDRERQLSEVLGELLTVPDTWVTFTEQYLQVLDGLAPPPAAARPTAAGGRAASARAVSYQEEQRRRELDRRIARRTETMTAWHLVLLDRFAGTPEEALLDRLVDHPALGGPEQLYFRARLARTRGDVPEAHQLIHRALEQLPGHFAFLDFAREIHAPLPPRAEALAAARKAPT